MSMTGTLLQVNQAFLMIIIATVYESLLYFTQSPKCFVYISSLDKLTRLVLFLIFFFKTLN